MRWMIRYDSIDRPIGQAQSLPERSFHQRVLYMRWCADSCTSTASPCWPAATTTITIAITHQRGQRTAAKIASASMPQFFTSDHVARHEFNCDSSRTCSGGKPRVAFSRNSSPMLIVVVMVHPLDRRDGLVD